MAQNLRTCDSPADRGVIALFGAPGAGKTTLCKLAIRLVLANGADSLALIPPNQLGSPNNGCLVDCLGSRPSASVAEELSAAGVAGTQGTGSDRHRRRACAR
jgi:hypothetical protein